MLDRIPHVLDCIIVCGSTSLLAASQLLLADTVTAETTSEDMRLLLLPLIGGMIVSGGLIMLNPNPETRRITIGRAFLGLFFGVLAPQIFASFHPALGALGNKPFLLLLVGGVASGLAYVLSKPFANQLYARSERIAAREANRLEGKFSPPVKKSNEPENTP